MGLLDSLLQEKSMEDVDDVLSYLKLDPDHAEKIAALIPKETLYEQIIRYGLYIGAVFQLLCILAVILLPSTEEKEEIEDDRSSNRASSPTGQSSRKQKKTKNKKKLA